VAAGSVGVAGAVVSLAAVSAGAGASGSATGPPPTVSLTTGTWVNGSVFVVAAFFGGVAIECWSLTTGTLRATRVAARGCVFTGRVAAGAWCAVGAGRAGVVGAAATGGGVWSFGTTSVGNVTAGSDSTGNGVGVEREPKVGRESAIAVGAT